MKKFFIPAVFSLGIFISLANAEQRTVALPPADAPNPPAIKAPSKEKGTGESQALILTNGPDMKKDQERTPPPPTTLTVMYKVQYGDTLNYVKPDGTRQSFEQWESFKNDAASLLIATNEGLKDGNNYQCATKPLASNDFDPVDIPILYMTGDYDFVLKDAEVENLRRYLMAGGTILFNAARGMDAYNIAVVREMQRVFPEKKFMRIPPDHPLFNSYKPVTNVTTLVNGVQASNPPEVFSLDIGTRAAAILVPYGLGTAWSSNQQPGQPHYNPAGKHILGEGAVRLGVNMVSYVLAMTEYSKFLAQQFPKYNNKTRSGDVFRFASVRYSGSWDVNPGIQNSILLGLNDNTHINVDFAPHVVTLDDSAQTGNYPVLFMTGHYNFKLTAQERTGLIKYLKQGGMLVASAAGGLSPFDTAFRRELKEAFPNGELVKLPPTHPLFAGWSPTDRVAYTDAAMRDNSKLDRPEFYGLFINDRLAVLYTSYDLNSGLNHESNVYAKGLVPTDGLRVAINIITYALSH
ncbi:MAG: DUF4159 domain-containing protein [Chthoniobacterales bacterium]